MWVIKQHIAETLYNNYNFILFKNLKLSKKCHYITETPSRKLLEEKDTL